MDSLEDRIKSQIGGMVLQILTQQMQIAQLQEAVLKLQPPAAPPDPQDPPKPKAPRTPKPE
jgi:hypothetical protein